MEVTLLRAAGKIEKVKKNEIGGQNFAGTEVYRERLEII